MDNAARGMSKQALDRQIPKHFGYNIGNGLSAYKTALASYASQSVKVYCIGDSVTRGEYSSVESTKSWVGQLRTALQGRYGDAGEGFIGPNEANLPTGAASRWTLGAGWLCTMDQGFGNRWATSGTSVLPSSVTFEGTAVELLYVKATGGGTGNIAIDGTPVGTIDCNIAGADITNKETYTGLAFGTHTMTLTPQGNGNIMVDGIIARKGTAGIEVDRIAVSGTRAGHWTQALTLARWASRAPNLVVIAFGLNESAVSGYKIDMAILINHFKGLGASVLLLPYFRPSDAWTTKWYEFVDANYDLADQYNCGLVDIYQAWWGSYEIAQGLGLFGKVPNDWSGGAGANTAHPSDAGYRYIANIIEPHLLL